jgi:transposase-like protein
MPSKRYSVEQIVAKSREAERLQAQGQTIAQLCKRLGISDQTFFRWRIKYGALKEDEAQRLKALEAENARLKKIVAEQARRLDAVCYLLRRHPVSERRACRLPTSTARRSATGRCTLRRSCAS